MAKSWFFDQGRIARNAPIVTCSRSALVLIAAALASSPGLAAQAAAHHGHHHKAAAKVSAETVEQRITTLHAALKITDVQEADWHRVTDIMLHNEAVMRGMRADTALGAAVSPSAVDDLKIYEKFNQAHVNGLAELIPAFTKLYGTMSRPQQIIADNVFRSFGRGHAPSRA